MKNKVENISVLIKPASSLCNMRCRYCFYADVSQHRTVPSFGIMSKETSRAAVDSIFTDLSDGGTVRFGFQGGEPTLAGLDYFEQFVDYVNEKRRERRIKAHWTLQTNGLLLDTEWCKFLRTHSFLTGLSLDGGAAAHNANRVDAEQRGTYGAVSRAKQLLDTEKADYNILCVLTSECAGRAEKIWRFLLRERIGFVQFIPCLPELNASVPSPQAITPVRFAQFYSDLFPLWAAEFKRGHYVSVKFFDDLINLLRTGAVNACGLSGQCMPQYIIEADGGVYPCDFYAIDEYLLGNITVQTPRQLFETETMRRFLTEKRKRPRICEQCRYLRICGGGCKRMSHTVYCGTVENGSIQEQEEICGYKIFLDKRFREVMEIYG